MAKKPANKKTSPKKASQKKTAPKKAIPATVKRERNYDFRWLFLILLLPLIIFACFKFINQGIYLCI